MGTLLFILLCITSSIGLISCGRMLLSDTYFADHMWYRGETPHMDMPDKFKKYCHKHNLLDKEERVSLHTMEQYKFYRVQLPTFICLVICSIASFVITKYSVMNYGAEFLDKFWGIIPVTNLFFTIILAFHFGLQSHNMDALDPTKDGKQHAIHWLMRGYTLALIISIFYTL